MNSKEIYDLVNLYFSLEIKKNAAHYMFGEYSEHTSNCKDQFLKVSHKIIENDLQPFLLEKINDSEKCDSDFAQIDFTEFGFDIDQLVLKKDVYEISHIEFNIVVYYSINQILDLSKNSEYWNRINRLTFLTVYENEYLKLKRNPIIDSILF